MPPDRREHAPPRRLVSRDRRHALGCRGELIAERHLHDLGLLPLGRNVRTCAGEIDLIALDRRGPPSRHALVFIEVKTRRLGVGQTEPRDDQRPLAGLRPRQRARLRRLAVAWLADHARARPTAAAIRFDALGVLLDAHGRARQIEHIEDAW